MFVIGGPVNGVACVAETRMSNPTPESSCSIDTTRPLRQQQHVEEKRACGRDSRDAEQRAPGLTY